MPRLTLNFALPLFFLAFRPCAYGQLLGPVAGPTVRLSSAPLLELLSSIPDYSADRIPSAVQEITEDEVADLEEGEESEADVFISSALAHVPEPVNLGGNGSLTLTRQNTSEKINAHYRNKDGSYNPAELARINHIMRCGLTGKETEISIKLVELLDAVEDKFGKKGLTLLSGYRTPKFNITIPGAAKRSLHMLGWAADIKIAGYSSTKVKKYGQKLRIGGVGYYPNNGFTHLDVGAPRYWVVKRPVRRRHYPRKSNVRSAGGAAVKKKKIFPASTAGKADRKIGKTSNRGMGKTALNKKSG